MLDTVICAVSNLFRVYLIYRFIQIFSCERKPKKIVELFSFGAFYVLNTSLFLVFHLAWLNLGNNVIGTSLLILLYTRSWKTNLFASASINLVNMGCDVLTTLTFVNYEDGHYYNQVYAAIAVFLIFICELVIEKIVDIQGDKENVNHISLICVPICSILLLYFLVYSQSANRLGISIVSFGLLMINFLMFYVYRLLVHSVEQKYEAEMFRQKTATYANQLDIIKESQDKFKALRHDLKHHINELKLLADRSGNLEIKKYISDMESFVQNPKELVSSGELEIDSVLNYMLQKAKQRLDTVNVIVQIPDKMKHSFDINVLMGNLLENAIEAARQTEEKFMAVKMQYKKGVLFIYVENSFSNEQLEKAKQRGKQNFTSKKISEKHGIGLKNVRRIVDENQGTMEIATKGTHFCVSLIFYEIKQNE